MKLPSQLTVTLARKHLNRAEARMNQRTDNLKKMYQPHYRKKASGVGILEVLVALVVVSIGVLGVAGLQLTGMKQSNGGYNRFRATLFAENIAARMRANETGVNDLRYDNFDSDVGINCGIKPAPYCQSNKTVAASSCNAEEMAAFDLFSIACGNWSGAGEAKNGVMDELANGRVRVNCDAPCTDTSNYTVLITWDENTGLDGNEATLSEKRVQVRFNP